jgi:nitrogen fixation NifU-like protein
MNEDLEKKVREAIQNPQNMGELKDADAVGTVGNSECGEMLRMWVKYREEKGRKVIDQATFQSFGCETAIAVASMATEMIRGKTAEEALALQTEELSGELGPLPPMKIHCAELVEGAMRSALEGAPEKEATNPPAKPAPAGNLIESLNAGASAPTGGVKIVMLDDDSESTA